MRLALVRLLRRTHGNPEDGHLCHVEQAIIRNYRQKMNAYNPSQLAVSIRGAPPRVVRFRGRSFRGDETGGVPQPFAGAASRCL